MDSRTRDRSRLHAVVAMVVVAVAVALRVPGLFTDLWLDEIWSVLAVRALDSPLGVFTSIRTFNNHHLNSLLLYAIGEPGTGAPPWLIYRLPSLAAGAGSVLLAGLVLVRRDSLQALFAMVLTAFSFSLVFYSSEARGYSMMVFFALLSFWLLLKYEETGEAGYRFGYWVSSILGLLSSVIYLFFLMGALAWAYARDRARKRGGGGGEGYRSLARLHDLPLLALGLLFVVDLARSDLGGAIEYSGADVLGSTLSLSIGGPLSGSWMVVAAVTAASVFTVELLRIRRNGSDLWILFAVAMVGFPALLILAVRPQYLFPRYFIVSIALFQLLLAGLLAHGWRAGAGGRVLVSLGLVVVLGGNLLQLRAFLRVGRGHYGEAVAWIAQRDPAATVGSDHDFRNQVLVDYYRTIASGASGVRYLPANLRPEGGWDWWIMHGFDDSTPPSMVEDEQGARYRYERSYPSSPLSGMVWHLYSRSPADGRPRRPPPLPPG